MKKIKKISSLILILVLASAFFTGCANKSDETVVFIPQNLDNGGYWDKLSDKLQTAIEGNGYSYKEMGSEEWDSKKQADVIKEAIKEKADVIILAPVSNEVSNLFDAIKEANSNDIPIILIDTDINRDLLASDDAEVVTYVGVDNYDSGKKIAYKVADNLDNNSQVAVLDGSADSLNGVERCDGFSDGINKKGLELVARVNTSWSVDEGYTNTKLILDAYPDIKALFVVNSNVYKGVVKAVQESGKSIITATFDCDDVTEQALNDGILLCTFNQSSENMAKSVVDVLNKLDEGKNVDSVTKSEGEIVTK